MDVMSAKEAAQKWDVCQRWVSELCSMDRIDGAQLIGGMWLIPSTAQKPQDGRIVRFEPPADMKVKPFLKWAGGKSQILGSIRAQYPTSLGTKIKKYAEPFVGGGAVLFDILSRYDMEEIYISDINRELILTYITIRDNLEDLIALLSGMESTYISADDNARKAMYYNSRDRFNHLVVTGVESAELSALFIFLNRTCFNGLYRVNSKGIFNVPQGRYKNPKICDVENLCNVSKALQGVDIVHGEYDQSRSFIDSNTFAYFDPPYRPLTETANFTSYAKGGFDDQAQTELAYFIQELSDKGAYIIASNSDPKNVCGDDNFFDDLYSRFEIMRISASRAINSRATNRGSISELLICSP